MNKKEQIMQLVREWQEEDKEKRSVTLTMIEVVNEREDGYDTQCSGVTIGTLEHLVDHFWCALRKKRDPLYKPLHLALIKFFAKRHLDRLSKVIDELHYDGSENATEGGKSSENNTNE